MSKRTDNLIQGICGSPEHPLAPFLHTWSAESRPFLVFAESHATKLRKKARLAASADERGDLLAELAVAAFLLRDRSFSVLYEPFRAAGQRGPDFQVTFKTHSSFLVEVTRPRWMEPPGGALMGNTLKIARVTCDKIGQCAPGTANLLVVVLPPGGERDSLVPGAVHLLGGPPRPGQLPEVQPEGVRDYHRHRQRLSGILLCSFEGGRLLPDLKLWQNPGARHPLPPGVPQALARAAS
ncbi:hypothetical protein DEIPH_ctg004orf0199 [Deinococcus phoenicis]|uniref:Uncharacterized protein n=1 Tax=Deinococcus phoenicis TaxID=1476583 RepID=A0A016QU72_9DEIO|nr:hypothetical protein [Deinococcus phoenicis]EYB69665.1 hypothetical protein DEIPH_ctg004orf0199 [Deinococcus phoenicis]